MWWSWLFYFESGWKLSKSLSIEMRLALTTSFAFQSIRHSSAPVLVQWQHLLGPYVSLTTMMEDSNERSDNLGFNLLPGETWDSVCRLPGTTQHRLPDDFARLEAWLHRCLGPGRNNGSPRCPRIPSGTPGLLLRSRTIAIA